MRRLSWVIFVAVALGLAQAGCGSSTSSSRPVAGELRTLGTTAPSTRVVRRRPARYLVLLASANRPGLLPWTPIIAVRGQVGAWIARVRARGEPGLTVTLVRFDQRLVRLALHAGSEDPGGAGWRYGDSIR